MLKFVIMHLTFCFLLVGTVSGRPPSNEAPNIEMKFTLDQKPEKIGDIFTVSCEVSFNLSEDSIIQKYFWGMSDKYFAKCYFDTHPRQSAKCMNSATWTKAELGRKFTYSAEYEVLKTGKFSIWPVVEIHDSQNSGNDKNFIARNTVKGSFIHIMGNVADKSGESPKTDMDNNDVTVFEAKIPSEHNQVDLNGKIIDEPDVQQITPPPRQSLI